MIEIFLAFLFDADGVLLDSREWSLKYYLQVAEKLGLRVPTRQEFLDAWPLPWEQLLNTLWPGIDVEAFDRACEEIEKIRIPQVEGARKMLSWLKKGGYFSALISNRDHVSLARKMGQAGMPLGLFDYVQAVDDFPFVKPDPRVFNRALLLLSNRGIPRSKTIFVGDTISDFKAAKGAYIEFVGVLSGGVTKQQFLYAGLDEAHILESVRDLPKILAERK